MPVKDLVHRYESSSPSTTPSPSARHGSRREEGQRLEVQQRVSELAEVPPPRPARFIKKPEKAVAAPSHASSPLSPLSTTATTLTAASQAEDPASHFDEPYEPTTPLHSPHWSRLDFARLQQGSKGVDGGRISEEAQSLVQHAYPPSSSGNGIPLKSPAAYSHYTRHHSHHNPIPATVLFAKDAAPLSLPKLDQYLSELEAPFPTKEHDSRHGDMFSPLDRLAKTGKSLEDLEYNSSATPGWRNRSSILWTISSTLIGFLGSSALASFYSLQGLISTLQIFALILSTVAPQGKENWGTWKQVFLGTIPNVLALNFAPLLIQSLIFLAVFIVLGAILLYFFWRSTTKCDRYNSIEGLQLTETPGTQWGLVLVTFLLVIAYLPLTTMSVHVLVWSEELWAIPNPYKNATTFPPVVAPLGPSNQYRDSLDFCWTTTMKRNEVNLAPLFVVLSAISFIFMSLWFPLALYRVINRSTPKVDNYTELGRRRPTHDIQSEYQRLLNRDNNPFAFLYNNFRPGRAAYITSLLAAKLCTLLIIAVIDSNNCLFRSFVPMKVAIARQSLLVFATLVFFLRQCFLAPYLDPVNNASEWTSRLNYLTTSLTTLFIVIDIPAREILDSYILYTIYIITYGLGFYFTILNTGWMQRFVKILFRRIDFSVDVFSPRLDVSPSSIHTRRRIWQESISALLLTHAECRIPPDQNMQYAESRSSEFPPYLLNFMDTPGERHVENLKILRDVGSLAYNRAVALSTGPESAWYRHLEDLIQKNFIGPDSYWKPPGEETIPGCSHYFGNAWWIPFPPALVIQYDHGPRKVLRDADAFEAYIDQNSSPDIGKRRFVRMALRSLENRVVYWPYEHVEPVGSHLPWCCGRRYDAVTSRHYQRAVLEIKRRGYHVWHGLHLGSGFDITLRYSKSVQVSGEVIGLTEDFDLTSSLARFLDLNRDLIDHGLYDIQEKLSDYRRFHRRECRRKARVLSYRFLSFVYDQPREPGACKKIFDESEQDTRVKDCVLKNEESLGVAYQRLTVVSESEAATWWYIFWDDLWRRNHDTISGLRKHEVDFNPHYRTSIAYTPLPRAALESFLTQRGLFHKTAKWTDFFHTGFLNKLYIRLNDAVFKHSKRAIHFHLGNDKRELDMEEIDFITQYGASTLGTGGGTNHDVSGILARPTYRWEGLLSDPPKEGGFEPRRKWLAKLGVWFGLTPFWRASAPSNGVSLDVKLQNGKYVLIDEDYLSFAGTTTGTAVGTPSARTRDTGTNRTITATLIGGKVPNSIGGK